MNVPAKPQPYRLALPFGMEPPKWRVLTEVIFPKAQNPNIIMLALDYCRVRNLDVMKRPVNIVPMWDSKLRRYVDTIWPSINEIEVTAARSKEYAGLDDAVFGPLVTKEFSGEVWEDGRKVQKKVTVTFPEYCKCTVYRIINGQRCPFTVPVYWLEEYARVGGSEIPNHMWTKRPRDQFAKVSRAASLRAAFPEEQAAPSDVEMAGQQIIEDEEPAPSLPAPADNWIPPGEPLDPPHDPETGELINKPRELTLDVTDNVVEAWPSWGHRFIDAVKTATTVAEVEQWQTLNEKILAACLDQAPKIHPHLIAAIGKRRIVLEAQ